MRTPPAPGIPSRMPASRSLVLGPLLRYVGETEATVWVECGGPCEVEVLGCTARTFCVEGRHYAIVVVEGLEPGGTHPYDVKLGGERAWPPPDSALPSPAIRTLAPGRPLRLAFGSCRASAPHEPPWTRKRASDPRGLGIDALRALALRAATRSRDGDGPGEALPDLLLMLGDQLYADQPSPRIRDTLREHREHPEAPQDQLEDFYEYCVAYCDAWSEPHIRWLLSTVPSAMVFDDHEIHDEWMISLGWLERMRREPWYDRRVTAGLMTYWLYQHLGNLSPAELAQSELLARVRAAGDGGDVLRDVARTADRQTNGSRWSHMRDLGRTRLVVLDSRGARVLQPGRRQMVNDGEWAWLRETVADPGYDHLLLATSIPVFLAHGLHGLQAWSERVCDGAWGAPGRWLGERVRRRANLDHWASFQSSFRAMAQLLEELSCGRLREPPRSIVLLSGDVHHCYLARVGFRPEAGARTPVWQAVCSGLRKQLDAGEKTAMKAGNSRAGSVVGRALARSARVEPPPLGWRMVEPPLYANQVATLDLAADRVDLRVETTKDADWRAPRLTTALRHRLLG